MKDIVAGAAGVGHGVGVGAVPTTTTISLDGALTPHAFLARTRT